MNKREKVRAVADEVAKQAADQGKLIEAGWIGLKLTAYPNGMVPAQEKQLRDAFFGGAQHLYGSIMGIMDDGAEPTENDMKKMELIDAELQGYLHELTQRGKLHPDIAPEKPSSH